MRTPFALLQLSKMRDAVMPVGEGEGDAGSSSD